MYKLLTLITFLFLPLISYSQTAANSNEILITKYFEQAWNQGNLDILEKVTPPDFILHFSGKANKANYEQHKTVIRYWRKAIPDYSLTLHDVFSDDDKVVARFSFSGTHRDTLLGIPPTGNTILSTGIWICKVENRQLRECWAEYDIQRIMGQIQSSASDR